MTRRATCEDQVTALQPILDEAPEASFGDGKETRCSWDVRKAKQLPASKFDLENFNPQALGILDAIQSELGCPALTAELYSMNLYLKGGHFKEHMDTPRGDGLVLPSCSSYADSLF